jgi:deoxyribodipyrimidine photo-lyase
MRAGYWLRNDIRLNDNIALFKFCLEASEGIIFWCPDRNFRRLSEFKQQSTMHALFSLNQKMMKFKQEVVIFDQPINQISPLIFRDLKIQRIYYSSEHAFHEKDDEKNLFEIAKEQGVEIHFHDQMTLVAEKNLPFLLQDMPFVFTDFRKKIEPSLLVDSPVTAPLKFPDKISLSSSLERVSIPLSPVNNCNSSEDDLIKRLRYYFWENKCVLNYKETRNGLLDKDDSTRFSEGLNIGSISARTIYSELKKFEKEVKANESTYWVVFELLWRDYFKFFSAKNGNKIFLREGLKSNSIKKYIYSDQERINFLKWCEGKTENQFINANMNELNKTGWMSNRGRQNVASYLIHQLECPWTWGAEYFQRKLIDYDPDLNWGNWLYLSGQGSDPRSRVFNVDRQTSVYDPEGLYQKKWT